MTPTTEQEQVVEAVRAGGAVKVKAYAGAGKTSTLRMAAESRGKARGLYLAFNREIANEAARKFPQNTRCRTVHSLAYSGTSPDITRKLNGLLCERTSTNCGPLRMARSNSCAASASATRPRWRSLRLRMRCRNTPTPSPVVI